MTYELHRRSDQGENFNDVLLEQFRRAPWLLMSAGFHGLLMMLLLLFIGDPPSVAADTTVSVAMEQEIVEAEPIVDTPPEDKIPDEAEDPDPDLPPVMDPATHDESADNESFEENRGDEDQSSDKTMDSRSNNDVIGLGGGPGGDFGGGRGGKKNLIQGGGTPKTEVTVGRALEWLAQHQSLDGSWDADGFMQNGDPSKGPLCDGKGSALYDVGVSGLALLCFLGAGETHRAGEYKTTVARGLKWLMDHQDAEGCFGSKSIANYTYGHAIAALAMAEAYGMTKSGYLLRSAQAGINYIGVCQNPYKAWRYQEADGQNDTSVTGWMVMALKSAKMAGLEVDENRLHWALDWIEECTDEESGRTGYVRRGELPVRETGKKEEFPAEESESLTAVGLLCRIFAGQDPAENRMVKLGADLIGKKLPVWDQAKGTIDMYYWYYGTLAMFQVGGDNWRRWNGAMTSAIIDRQRQDGNFAGSWDPKGAWGETGGRVYSTALMTLSLEVYYRYARVFGTTR